MSTRRQAIRDELLVLARLQAGGHARDLKPLCLALIDHVATWASDVRSEIPADVLAKLTAAMRAAGRADVAGVVEEVEGALRLLDQPRPAGGEVKAPPPARPGRGPSKRLSTKAARGERRAEDPKPLAEAIDPLLARLRAKASKD